MVSMKSLRRLCLSIGLIFTIASSGCSAGKIAQAGDQKSWAAALDANMPRLLKLYKVPGASVAVSVNGQPVWSQGYGLADVQKGIPAGPDTVYQVASISKPVTAWGVMKLVEQGKLDLDAPVSRYLTRWKLPPSPYDPDGVTIRRLLSHSAGLSVHGYPGVLPDTPIPSLEESLSGAGGSAYAVKQAAQAGRQFRYSGGGYTLLQLVVEEVTGQSFAEYMQNEVLTPLGMSHSSFDWRSDLRADTATGYDRRGKALPNYLFAEMAAAGLYTTAGELARFGAASLPGGNGDAAGRGVLAPESVAAMFKPAVAMPAGTAETFITGMDAYGLGYFIEDLGDGSQWYSHDGGNAGWRSQLVIAPKQNAVLVVLTNSDNGAALAADLMGQWAKWLGADTPKLVQNLTSAAITIQAIAIVLLAAFGIWLCWFALAVARHRRRFYWKLGWKQTSGLLGAVLLAGTWAGFGNTLVLVFFPQLVDMVGFTLLVWAFAMAMNALTAASDNAG